MQMHQALRTDIGHADFPDSALLNKISQPIEKRTLLPGGVTSRAPMQLDSIHAALKSPLTGDKRLHQPAPSKPPGERGKFGGHSELGATCRLQRTEKAPQEFFASAVEHSGSIGISGVDQTQTCSNRLLKCRLQNRVVNIRVVSPEQLVPPGPGSKTDSRHTALEHCAP